MAIVQPTQTLAPEPAGAAPEWRDLVLYLVVGGGGFVASSLVAGLLLPRGITLLTSAAAYTLNVLFFGGTVLVLGAARGKLDLRALGFNPPRISARQFLGAIALSLALLPVRGLVGILVQYLAGGTLNGLQGRMDLIVPGSFTWLGFLVTLVGAGILVPISEELFFRGALFTWFRQRYNFPVALLVSSTVFALGHIDTIGVVAATLILALVNGWLLERTKTLWAPIMAHITTNSFAVLYLYAVLLLAPSALNR